jgi:hypothetical protein
VAFDRARFEVEDLEVERILAFGSDSDVTEDEPDALRAVHVWETSCGHEEIWREERKTKRTGLMMSRLTGKLRSQRVRRKKRERLARSLPKTFLTGLAFSLLNFALDIPPFCFEPVDASPPTEPSATGPPLTLALSSALSLPLVSCELLPDFEDVLAATVRMCSRASGRGGTSGAGISDLLEEGASKE